MFHLHVGRRQRLLEPVMNRNRDAEHGFTLIELMVVVGLIAVILMLVAPSFRDMILMQRLRGINAQVVADVAYARSEAISRGSFVQVRFQSSTGSSGMSCYIIYSRLDRNNTPQCDCTAPAGARCSNAGTVEVRTAQMPIAQSVLVSPPAIPAGSRTFYTIDPRTGGLLLPMVDSPGIPPDEFPIEVFIDAGRKFVNSVGLSGRVKVCAPIGSVVGGEAC